MGVLLLVSLAGGARLLWVNAALVKAQAELDAVRPIQPLEELPSQSKKQPLAPDQQKALIRTIVQLNQPWPVLLDAIESSATTQVALLSLNFEPANQRVRGAAEAKNFKSMVAFMARLDSVPAFQSTQLMNHQLDEAAPFAPIRFEFAVEWRGGMP